MLQCLRILLAFIGNNQLIFFYNHVAVIGKLTECLTHFKIICKLFAAYYLVKLLSRKRCIKTAEKIPDENFYLVLRPQSAKLNAFAEGIIFHWEASLFYRNFDRLSVSENQHAVKAAVLCNLHTLLDSCTHVLNKM